MKIAFLIGAVLTMTTGLSQVAIPPTEFKPDCPRLLVERAIRAMPHPITLLEQVRGTSGDSSEQIHGAVPIAGSRLADCILFIAAFDPDVWKVVWDLADLKDKEFIEKLWFLNRLITVRGVGEEDSNLRSFQFGDRRLRIQLEAVRSIPETVAELTAGGWTPKSELDLWLNERGRSPLSGLSWVLR